MTGIVIDGFAGPGGWSVALQRLGIPCEVGIELDPAACATRAAAGHRTIRADISAFPVEQMAGRVKGAVFSPVCTTFSAAGKRAGNAVTDVLESSVLDAFEGSKTRAAHRREMASVLRRSWWPSGKLTRAERSAAIWKAVRSASLVVEPARYIRACRPEWVALEQVPSVLPLWKVYAAELERMGYSAWCGKLNSADYGVPQTRERAILIASRTRRVGRPEATHYDPRKGMQLFGDPWVSMAEALGWGATGRPGPAVTAGGVATGGAEPFPTRARNLLETERDAGRWVLHTNRDQQPDGSRQTADPCAGPAPSFTAKAGGQWVLRRERSQGRAEHDANRDRPLGFPAPTVSGRAEGRMSWALRMDTQSKATLPRGSSEPAPTMHFGHRSNLVAWVSEQDSVRITVAEAAALQSFPADYPWRGTKTLQFRQVGDAVPPGLALAVLGEAAGIDWQPVAAKYALETRLIASDAA